MVLHPTIKIKMTKEKIQRFCISCLRIEPPKILNPPYNVNDITFGYCSLCADRQHRDKKVDKIFFINGIINLSSKNKNKSVEVINQQQKFWRNVINQQQKKNVIIVDDWKQIPLFDSISKFISHYYISDTDLEIVDTLNISLNVAESGMVSDTPKITPKMILEEITK